MLSGTAKESDQILFCIRNKMYDKMVKWLFVLLILNRYIMFDLRKIPVERRTISRGEGNLVSRLIFFANNPLKHDISV